MHLRTTIHHIAKGDGANQTPTFGPEQVLEFVIPKAIEDIILFTIVTLSFAV